MYRYAETHLYPESRKTAPETVQILGRRHQDPAVASHT